MQSIHERVPAGRSFRDGEDHSRDPARRGSLPRASLTPCLDGPLADTERSPADVLRLVVAGVGILIVVVLQLLLGDEQAESDARAAMGR